MGFSRTNTTMDGWKCDKCNRVFLNAEDAEDCCVELGEPDKIVLPKCYNCQELEAERGRLQANLDDMFGVGKVCLECDRRAKYIGEVIEERDRLKAAITTPELYVGIISDVIAEERERVVAENLNLSASHAALVEAAKDIDDEYHPYWCSAWIKERGGGTFFIEEGCNCGVKRLKAALAEVNKDALPRS